MNQEILPGPMLPSDYSALDLAVQRLEHPGWLMRASHVLGKPIEGVMGRLPSSAQKIVHSATEKALRTSLNVALTSLSSKQTKPANRVHKGLGMLSGAIGGAGGLASLAIELPVSTTLMLRSVADIARSEGEDLRLVDVQLACLEVFALGGRSSADDGAETGYYEVRAGLAVGIRQAVQFITTHGVQNKTAPTIVRLISQLAARFSIPVTEKAALQAIPLLGAASGAAINLAFMNHFQDMAHGHFTVRRLEHKYGVNAVQSLYEEIRLAQKVR